MIGITGLNRYNFALNWLIFGLLRMKVSPYVGGRAYKNFGARNIPRSKRKKEPKPLDLGFLFRGDSQ